MCFIEYKCRSGTVLSNTLRNSFILANPFFIYLWTNIVLLWSFAEKQMARANVVEDKHQPKELLCYNMFKNCTVSFETFCQQHQPFNICQGVQITLLCTIFFLIFKRVFKSNILQDLKKGILIKVKFVCAVLHFWNTILVAAILQHQKHGNCCCYLYQIKRWWFHL